jgi:alkylhydroperoxidase/carboxymuconolactone decarboxylase family protein YurZ
MCKQARTHSGLQFWQERGRPVQPKYRRVHLPQKNEALATFALFDVLDAAVFNAYLLFKKDGSAMCRKTFMKNLAKQLVQKAALNRFNVNPRLPRAAKEAGIVMGIFLRRNPISNNKRRLLVGVGYVTKCVDHLAIHVKEASVPITDE